MRQQRQKIRASLIELASAVFLMGVASGRGGAFADARPADFGKQWVRKHPLTIMGEVYVPAPYVFDINEYMSMNLNAVFSGGEVSNVQTAAAAGVPWQFHLSPTRPYTEFLDVHKTMLDQVFANSYGTALMLPDEPTSDEFSTLGEITQWMHANHPGKLIYVTASQNDVTTLTSLVNTVQPDMLMFDRYPFYASGGDDLNEWFSMLMAVRQVSLAHQIPYGGWLQSFQGPTLRVPSESDSRFLGFTLLTAGYTTLDYYIYEEHELNNAPDRIHSMLLDNNGNPTPLYYQVAAANLEYAHLGQSLRSLTSTNVRFIPGRHTVFGSITAANATPDGLSNWNSGAGGDPHIQAVSVDLTQPNALGSVKNGSIGFFTDDENAHYFILTNLNYGPTLSASDAALSFSINFDSSVNSIWLLNRLTGVPEEIILSNHMLNWTLPGGTGDLFKYDNGSFAGVPEPSSFLLLVVGSGIALRQGNRRKGFRRVFS